jgi:hypothetical protein
MGDEYSQAPTVAHFQPTIHTVNEHGNMLQKVYDNEGTGRPVAA